MVAQNKITLTIAGDSTGVERALKRTEAAAAQAGESVATSSKTAGEGLEGLGRSARSTKEILRGMGDASRVVGGEEGAMAQQAIFAASAIKDLGRGTGELVKTLGMAKIATGGVVLAIAALGAGISAHIDHTNIMNEVNRTAADTVDTVVGSVQFLTQKIPGLSSVMDKARGVSRGWSDEAHGLGVKLDEVAEKAKAAAEAVRQSFLFQAPDTNPGGDAFVTAADLQNIATQVYAGQSPGYDDTEKTSTAAAKRVSTGIDKVAQAAADKLARWQDIANKFSSIAKNIADALGPKLVAGVASPLMLAKGTTLLDNLKTQLKDTLHLQSDLAKLSKMKLDRGLLEQLTAGGLGSLGAADEILAGGKSGVHAVNRVAGQISAASGSIAGADAARQLADSLKKPQVVELRVSQGGDDILDRWLSKTLKTKGPKYYGLKAA